MWLYIILLLFGTALMICGIVTTKQTRKKEWHILTAVGAIAALIGMILFICVLLLVNRDDMPAMNDGSSHIDGVTSQDEVGGDWQTWRGYSDDDYFITDELSICFSTLEDSNGYGVYNAADGTRIGTILFDDSEEPNPTDDWISTLEDCNGDGANDLGIQLTNGAVAWFCYDENLLYSWPERISGCFTRERVKADSTAYITHQFEPIDAREKLTDRQKALYDEMYPKIKELEMFSYDAATYGYDTLDDVFSAWTAISIDHLEIDNYFLIRDVSGEDGITTSLDSQYLCKWLPSESENPEDVRSGIARFDAAAEEIISGLSDNMTTREKYEYLAKAISERTSYDYNGESYASATPWGGIVGGLSICQGYSYSYAYLCEKANLSCKIVLGSSDGVSHSWNLIWLPEGTYHVDITWADEQGEPGSSAWMRYFALTQEEIEWDHIIDDDTIASGK